jgi:hypothetical protein
MKPCTGWQLEFGNGARAVIGQRELLRMTYEPETHWVPCAPPFCQRVLFWEHGALPLIDVGAWLGGTASTDSCRFVSVVGFQPAGRHAPEFGALTLASPPVRIEVKDEWACGLPETMKKWQRVACAAFKHGHSVMPVLDLGRVFTLSPTDA